jgi:hypothetical protein
MGRQWLQKKREINANKRAKITTKLATLPSPPRRGRTAPSRRERQARCAWSAYRLAKLVTGVIT